MRLSVLLKGGWLEAAVLFLGPENIDCTFPFATDSVAQGTEEELLYHFAGGSSSPI